MREIGEFMCCFSRPVEFVGSTQIFARTESPGRQVIAYSMNVKISQDLAMVLPLPVPVGVAEDAVHFINLEGYADFFQDMATAFPSVLQSRGAPLSRHAPQQQTLKVHHVGRFVASFVPSRTDFARLDERFRMPALFFDCLPRYEDWGFAVFQLKPAKSLFGALNQQRIHPMAFSFPVREIDSLFFPTVHLHDGTVPDRAHFDHSLYCQGDGLLGATLGWQPSLANLEDYVNADRSEGLIVRGMNGFTTMVNGLLPNEDIWLQPPEALWPGDLEGRGRFFAYRIDASCLYDLWPSDSRRKKWQRIMRSGITSLCSSIGAALQTCTDTMEREWRLQPITDDLLPFFMNGPQLWSGNSYGDGQRVSSDDLGRPGKVRFTVFTEEVSPQSITLGFSELPDETLQRQISQALAELLNRVIKNGIRQSKNKQDP